MHGLPDPEAIYGGRSHNESMAGSTNRRPPLPNWIYECFDCLRGRLCELETSTGNKSGLDRDDAVTTLVTSCAADVGPEDTKNALDRLLDHGYLYQVGSTLRLTIPDEQCPPQQRP